MPKIDFQYFKQDNPPAPPFVKIFLSDFGRGEDGAPLLSPRLYSNGEIDHHIDTLVRQLEEIRKRPKSKLKR